MRTIVMALLVVMAAPLTGPSVALAHLPKKCQQKIADHKHNKKMKHAMHQACKQQCDDDGGGGGGGHHHLQLHHKK